MRGVTPGALLFISLGMGVLGIIIGRVIFLPAKPVTPVPKGWEVQGWNACEMDLVTCQAELAGTQEELDIWQRAAEFCTRRSDGDTRRPKRLDECPSRCQGCYELVADVKKILGSKDEQHELSIEEVKEILRIKNGQPR
jgi:hypothetical protein